MTNKSKIYLIGGLLALALVGKGIEAITGTSATTEATAAETPTVAKAETATAPGKWDAYGICTQLALEKYGKGDMELVDAQDMGEGDWIVSGTTDIPGKRIYWTGEVQSNTDGTWSMKGWTDR